LELKSLKTLLERKNQRFVCTPAGNRTDGGSEFTVAIRHEVTAPLNDDELEQVSGQMGRKDQLLDVFSQYGSIRLYCDTLSNQSACYIAHPKEWHVKE